MSSGMPEPASGSGGLISIVLPVHNGERYLAESVASIFAQTYANWELILVDDASTDHTAEQLAEVAARAPSRVRVLRHDRNRGLPVALNTGFSAARGAYLTWTSDDNAYRPEALAALVAAMEASPALAAVYADYEVIDSDGAAVSQTRLPEPSGLINGAVGVPCFLWRAIVWERVGAFSEDVVLAEDYDYWLRILALGLAVAPLHAPLYRYRRHAASLTDRKRRAVFAAAERSLLRWKDPLVRGHPERRGTIWLYLSSLAMWRGAYGKVLVYSLRAALLAPRATAAHVSAFAWRRFARTTCSYSGSDADGKPRRCRQYFRLSTAQAISDGWRLSEDDQRNGGCWLCPEHARQRECVMAPARSVASASRPA